jgi:hypothetical protein
MASGPTAIAPTRGGLLRRPSPRPSGRLAQSEAHPRHAVRGDHVRGPCGSAARGGALAEEVRRGRARERKEMGEGVWWVLMFHMQLHERTKLSM